MDDLLREFLTETSESLDTVDNQLVRFEQDPNNAKILDNIFRLVHTIKGTCGFLGLPRLEALAHAGETLMGKFRDGMPVTSEAVSLILASIDRIKEILAGLENTEAEPEGSDQDLIVKLQEMVERGMAAMAAPAPLVASASGTRPLKIGEPRWVGTFAVSMESFAVKGTPCKGPSLAPLATALSAASAASNAFSAVRVTTALIFGFTALMRSKCAWTTSREESCPVRISSANAVASR